MFRPKLLRYKEGNSGLSGLLSSNDGLLAPERAIARRVARSTGFAFASVLVLMLLLIPGMGAQKIEGARPDGATLHGTVRDRAGNLVGDAQVILQERSLRATKKTLTDAAGDFEFTGVAMGAVTLTANSTSLRSATVSLMVSTPGEQPTVDLVLDAFDSQRTAAQEDAHQAMQFADNPDFAIAAVTDWTAAGGHGSDASLRTSEALTRAAVKLKPSDVQTAEAGSLGTVSEVKESESALQSAVEKDPRNFEANRRIGLFYLQAGRYQDAVRALQTAYQADSANYENEYDLARALIMAGDAARARDHVRQLMAHRQTADLHRMEGDLDEKLNDPLSAVHEFQQAASEDPSENNYFAWGSELLIHRAVWQAKEVFDEGARLYPQSARMLTARGAALFAGALYDEAALDLCKASDLGPESIEPYLFIGKIEMAAPNPLPCVVAKLARFEKLQPANSLANYYYAMALWKQQGQASDPQIMEQVEHLLTQAVAIDPKCADAYLELGNLSAGKKQWDQAIGDYLNAIQANPELNEAHYRLGVAYERAGENARATEQFQLHDAIARKQAAEIQSQREAVKQFQVELPDQMGKQQAR